MQRKQGPRRSSHAPRLVLLLLLFALVLAMAARGTMLFLPGV